MLFKFEHFYKMSASSKKFASELAKTFCNVELTNYSDYALAFNYVDERFRWDVKPGRIVFASFCPWCPASDMAIVVNITAEDRWLALVSFLARSNWKKFFYPNLKNAFFRRLVSVASDAGWNNRCAYTFVGRLIRVQPLDNNEFCDLDLKSVILLNVEFFSVIETEDVIMNYAYSLTHDGVMYIGEWT